MLFINIIIINHRITFLWFFNQPDSDCIYIIRNCLIFLQNQAKRFFWWVGKMGLESGVALMQIMCKIHQILSLIIFLSYKIMSNTIFA